MLALYPVKEAELLDGVGITCLHSEDGARSRIHSAKVVAGHHLPLLACGFELIPQQCPPFWEVCFGCVVVWRRIHPLDATPHFSLEQVFLRKRLASVNEKLDVGQTRAKSAVDTSPAIRTFTWLATA